MAIYKIFAGLGGSFGGSDFKGAEEYDNHEEAENTAYQYAIDDYESYEGLHGVPDENEIKEDYLEEMELDEDDLDEGDYAEIQERYNDERENWLEYSAEECDCNCEECDYKSDCQFAFTADIETSCDDKKIITFDDECPEDAGLTEDCNDCKYHENCEHYKDIYCQKCKLHECFCECEEPE